MKRCFAICVAVIGFAVLVSACSSGDHDSMSGSMHHGREMTNRPVVPGAPEVAVRAASLTFAPKQFEIPAGRDTTIVLTSSDVEHDVTVARVGHVVHVSKGATEKGGLMIERPGRYRFWCSVSGHAEAGMTGTITVTA